MVEGFRGGIFGNFVTLLVIPSSPESPLLLGGGRGVLKLSAKEELSGYRYF